jgi:hypothetical protein
MLNPEIQWASPPSPTLPARGRVPAGEWGKTTTQALNGTSPLAGEVGRGEPLEPMYEGEH